MKLIDYPPKYSICWYCHSKIKGKPTSEINIRYSCDNHLPLRIEWYCNRLSDFKWNFRSFSIVLPKHFKFQWSFRINSRFYLYEYREMWRLMWEKSFDPEWVLTQNLERLLSILQMYKTFL